MKVNFHKHPAVDFSMRLALTIIIISPVLYFSWDAVKGTSGSDYVLSVIFILVTGGISLVNYLFFSAIATAIEKCFKK
ncbi:conjugal transfer protein TrbE (plasmid) [Klebsiella michiganensis]|uniref:conjugal transfer protein TrbE n=1 Tax=Klebsiella michiganensis TaxID=1134687 RepID=UPI00265A4940|nr:conjugal transfer protein TrbE [Klebsiella michiganensis]WKJ95828.1 conjugal transfer protein TrbE [Klebsiella michiganensis]WKK01034.1 conjugal transfer protein TrbE [Klebsiella michiganensis]WKK02826.1 conjugal transfer protein TrbE [Klebsiella michiganensis]WKK06857.1 conjugal transfer protein TrbE [Klebsiella michiganensis]